MVVQYPVIVGIIAKLMALVDKALDSFVGVTNTTATDCNIPAYMATVTSCGSALAHLWEQAIYMGSNLLVQIMAALGAVNGS
jgi:type IV secretory pathway VirB6-like protein